MANNAITGYGYSIFKIFSLSGALIESINLDLPNEAGLLENNKQSRLEHKLLKDEEDVYDKKGWKITFTISYEMLSYKANSLKIQKLLDYNPLSYRIELRPRNSMLKRRFDVIYTGDSFDLGLLNGGAKAIGNSGIVIEFTTRKRVSSMNWTDPDSVFYTGFHLHNRLGVI